MNTRIAVAIEGSDETSQRIAEHFAQSTKFLVYEIDESRQIVKTETYFNPLKGHTGGSCQLPGYVKQFTINTIIAGGMGQKAISNFHSFGINVITASGMECNEALTLYLDQQLSGYEKCEGHGNNDNCGEEH